VLRYSRQSFHHLQVLLEMLGSSSATLSIDTRISVYYGLFFLSIGTVAPFAALWFDALGITPAMSGAIFAGPSIATVLFTLFIGGWADRLSDWRSAIIICNWIVLAVLCWLLFRQGPWDILIIWTVAGLFTRAGTPIMDAAALHSTQKTGSDFGRIRSFGSMGFIVGVLLAGALYEHTGTQWFVVVMLLTVIIRLMAAYALPRFRSAKSQSEYSGTPTSAISVLQQPGILSVLVGAALISASHGFNNMFSVVHWTNVGISTSMASILWAVGVVAEVALMWSFKSVAKRFSARKCLMVASLVCAARWFLAGTDPSLPQLFLLQSLHSITFGLTFLAIVNFISRRVQEEHAAQAQSAFTILMTLLLGMAIWLSGWLYGQFAGHSYWVMSILALLGGAFVAWSFRSNLEDPVVA